MKQILLVITFLILSSIGYANNFGIDNSTDRVRITITGEANGYTQYSWSIYDTDNNIKNSGTNSMPGSLSESQIASQLNSDGWIIRIIIEDEEDN